MERHPPNIQVHLNQNTWHRGGPHLARDDKADDNLSGLFHLLGVMRATDQSGLVHLKARDISPLSVYF